MPINTRHPEYTANAARWEKCRAFYAGEDVIKEEGKTGLTQRVVEQVVTDDQRSLAFGLERRDVTGTKWLPPLVEQTPVGYNRMKTLAKFFGATARTVDGVAGSITRRKAAVKLPPALEGMVDDCGGGVSLHAFIHRTVHEDILITHGGVLADKVDGAYVLRHYPAESITNWGTGFIALREYVMEPSTDDPYTLEAVEQYRELTFDENGDYIQQVWREKLVNKKLEWAKYGTPTRPDKRGRGFRKIPFYWYGELGDEETVSKPLVYDLVCLNHHHYILSADYGMALHKLAVPTPWVAGIQNDPNNPLILGLGSEEAILIPDPQGSAGFMEFKGQGLGSLEHALEETANQMAAVGARLIEPRKTQTETAESARVRQSGEGAVVMSVIDSVEAVINKSLKFLAEWADESAAAVQVVINRELLESKLTANEIIALLQAVQAGRLSHQSFHEALADANILRDGTTFTDEVTRILNQRIQNVPENTDTPKQVGDSGTAEFAGQGNG